MAAKPIRKLVVKTGEYIDNVTGKNKARWLQVGVMFRHDDGNFSIKMEALPIAKDFDGWISVFPIDDQQSGQANTQQQPGQQQPRQQNAGQAQMQAYQKLHQPAQPMELDSDIPF